MGVAGELGPDLGGLPALRVGSGAQIAWVMRRVACELGLAPCPKCGGANGLEARVVRADAVRGRRRGLRAWFQAK